MLTFFNFTKSDQKIDQKFGVGGWRLLTGGEGYSVPAKSKNIEDKLKTCRNACFFPSFPLVTHGFPTLTLK